MPEKKGNSIIPDMKVIDKKESPEQKQPVITDIDKLIEPPVKREGISAEKIEKAVRTADIPMILMIFVMIVFGLIVLYSVSGPDAYGQFQDSSWFLARQIRFTVAGIVMMLIVAFIPIEFFQ